MPNAIAKTAPWAEQSTALDRAILTGSLRVVKSVYEGASGVRNIDGTQARISESEYNENMNESTASTSSVAPTIGQKTFSKWGARVMIRFGYVHLLDWLYSVEPGQMHATCGELLPEVASAWGRVEVCDIDCLVAEREASILTVRFALVSPFRSCSGHIELHRSAYLARSSPLELWTMRPAMVTSQYWRCVSSPRTSGLTISGKLINIRIIRSFYLHLESGGNRLAFRRSSTRRML